LLPDDGGRTDLAILRNQSSIFRRGGYSLEPSSLLSQRCVSMLCMGSGCPQSKHRNWRPPDSLTSISFIGLRHCGQMGG
jgi:hypothetical protein